MRFNLSRNLWRKTCAVIAGLVFGSVAHAQYLMIPDSASAATTPASGTQHIMLFSATNGSLVDENFIPQATSPYAFAAPKQALQVGNEIWVSDGQATAGLTKIFCFTAVFNNSDPNPANWSRPTYLRTIGGPGGGISNIRGMCAIADKVYVLNTGTQDGAPGSSVIVFQNDGTRLSSFPVAASTPFGIDNLNGQLLITDFLGNNYYLYDTAGNGGVFVNNTSLGSLGPQQVVVLPTGSAGAKEFWVAASSGTGNVGVRRYDALGSQLAFYPVGLGCKGSYVLSNGDVLFTDARSAAILSGGVRKFSPGTPPASPIVREVQTVTVTGTGTYTVSYNGQTTAPITVGTSPATALGNLSNIGSGNVIVSGGTSPITVTFSAQLPRVLMTGATVSGDAAASVVTTIPGQGTITTMHDTGATAGTGSNPNFINPFTPGTPVTTSPYATGFAAASVNQAAVLAGTTASLTVNATLGNVPVSTNLVVTADFMQFGGSASQTLTPASGASNNAVFTYMLAVPASQAGGNYSVPLTVTDTQGRTGHGTLTMTVIAAAPAGAFSEAESNNAKAVANAVALTPGKIIWGTTTGAAGAGIGSADYFKLTTPAAALGIYVHDVYLTSSGTAGHVGTLRGLNQTSTGTGGAIGATDTLVQTSGLASTPTRMVQWYGFGKQEQVYYRVEGTTSTTAEYLATYQTSPVIPTVIPDVIAPGSVTFSPAFGNNAKFAMCLYDSNLNAVSSSPYMSNTTGGGSATRTLAAGTYYLALSDVMLANNLAAPADSAVQINPVLDFANAVANNQIASFSDTPTNLGLSISHGGGSSALFTTKTQAYQVLWFKMYVGSPASPQVDGAASPTPVAAGSSTQLTAMVQPAATSTGIAVTANLGALGGLTNQALTDMGGNTFGFTLNVPASQAIGLYTVPLTVSDAQSLSSAGSIVVRVIPAPAAGQTVEFEPNDNLFSATSAYLGAAGQGVYGTSLGAQTSADPSITRDYYVLAMPTAAQGIYRTRMTITTSGVAGHVGSLRGRSQAAGVINASSDVAFQTSSDQTSPARFNQWYGFGRGEQMDYRVDGTSLTTSEYVSTLSISPVTPIVVSGAINAGPVTIARGAGNSASTGLWLYDADLQPIAEAGAQGGDSLTRTLAPGTYYLAVSDGDTANNLPTPADSAVQTLPALGYANSIACASAATAVPMNMSLTHAGGTATATGTKAGAFDIVWYQFTVANTVTCCRGTTCLTVASGACTGVVAGSVSTPVGSCGSGGTTATCCYGDFDHINGRTIDDIFSYLNAWFARSPYAKVGGNGTTTPTIDDIFLFLNYWFGGCH